MKCEDYQVTALYLRCYLSGLRHLTGTQYPRLLDLAGFGQYANRYPPPTLHVVGTGKQILMANTAISSAIGPEIFDLFLRNLGREFAHGTSQEPKIQALGRQITTKSNLDEISNLIKAVIHLNEIVMVGEIILMEVRPPANILLTYNDCIHCAHWKRGQANRPVCVGAKAYYKEVLHNLTGLRFVVEETDCGSMHGTNTCQFEIRKL